LFSSTTSFGQTRSISSAFETARSRASTSTTSMSNARPPQLDRALAGEQAPLRRHEAIALEAVFGGRGRVHDGQQRIHGASLATARPSVNSG
jgi:hypothetical protein